MILISIDNTEDPGAKIISAVLNYNYLKSPDIELSGKLWHYLI